MTVHIYQTTNCGQRGYGIHLMRNGYCIHTPYIFFRTKGAALRHGLRHKRLGPKAEWIQ